jgi:hypothetical protein
MSCRCLIQSSRKYPILPSRFRCEKSPSSCTGKVLSISHNNEFNCFGLPMGFMAAFQNHSSSVDDSLTLLQCVHHDSPFGPVANACSQHIDIYYACDMQATGTLHVALPSPFPVPMYRYTLVGEPTINSYVLCTHPCLVCCGLHTEL